MTQGLSGYYNYATGAGGGGSASGTTSPLQGDSTQTFGQPDMDNQLNPVTAYGGAASTAWNQAGNYAGKAQQQNQAAPQINNPYAAQTQQQIGQAQKQQGQLVAGLQQTAANGQDSLAYKQYLQSVAQGQAAQTAVANSSAAGAAGAGARRSAQQQNAMTGAGSQAGGTLVAQQAQQQAQNQLGTTLGQQGQLAAQDQAFQQQNAYNQAAMQQAQTGINFGAQQGYNQLALGEQQMNQSALTGAAEGLAGSQGIITGEEGANFNTSNMVAGAGLSGLSDAATILGASGAGQPSYAQQAQSSQSYNNSMGFGYEGGVNT